MKNKIQTEILSRIIEISQENLYAPSGQQVLFYLSNERKLSAETISEFKIGAFPDSFSRVRDFFGHQNLYNMGIHQSFSEHYRVIIPIYNQYNEPVAIMGRCIYPESERKDLKIPKYNNSVYLKNQNLFGLNVAKKHILQNNKVLVVEGNFDVLSCHQNGKPYTVAISSTSLSKKQHILLKRYTSNIMLMLDQDEPGQESMQRIKKAYPEVKLLRLPPNIKDIDEYFNRRS